MDQETSQIIEGQEITYKLIDRAEYEETLYGPGFSNGGTTYKAYLSFEDYRKVMRSFTSPVEELKGMQQLFLSYSRGQIALYCLSSLKANQYLWNGEMSYFTNGLDRACRIARLGKR